MLTGLKSEARAVGAKQARRALQGGQARCAFLAEDADPQLTSPLEGLCHAQSVPVQWVPTMKELGRACGIAVGAAVAVLLKGQE